jgi:hypothetical protein
LSTLEQRSVAVDDHDDLVALKRLLSYGSNGGSEVIPAFAIVRTDDD